MGEATSLGCDDHFPSFFSFQTLLKLFLKEVGSVPRAIEFVESHDKDLWYRLIEHSLKNETFLSELLDHAGVYDVDLPRLVAEIPKGMYIPGLRDKLVKIISDYHFQVIS